MATKAQLKAQTRYDKTHTKSILFKLNQTSDADILAKLESVGNRQGYVKKLIRRDIRGNDPVISLDAIRYLICPVAKKHNLRSVYVFGSYARGEAGADSDVDLMIEGGNIRNAETYFSIAEEFSNALGKNVDLVMAEAALNNATRSGKRFLNHFERDKVLLYEQV